MAFESRSVIAGFGVKVSDVEFVGEVASGMTADEVDMIREQAGYPVALEFAAAFVVIEADEDFASFAEV